MKSNTTYTGVQTTYTLESVEEIKGFYELFEFAKNIADNYTGIEYGAPEVEEIINQQVSEIGGVVEVLKMMDKSGLKASGVTRTVTVVDEEITHFSEALKVFSTILASDFGGEVEKPSSEVVGLYQALWAESVKSVQKLTAQG